MNERNEELKWDSYPEDLWKNWSNQLKLFYILNSCKFLFAGDYTEIFIIFA